MTDLPPERSIERLRYLNTPTSNWAADRIAELEKPTDWPKTTIDKREEWQLKPKR